MAKMKTCKDCKAEIPKAAKKCMHCGSKQGVGFFGGLVVIVFAFFVFIWVVGKTNSPSYSSTTTAAAPTPELSPQEKAAQQLRAKQSIGLAWVTRETTDKVSGKKALNHLLLSTNTINFGFPYQGEQRATLTVRKHPRYGKDVFLSVDKGQMLCSSYDGCSVTVRFGKGKPVKYKAVAPDDNSSNMVFISNYAAFVANMKKVKNMVIAKTFYKEGDVAFEFNVSEFPGIK